MGAEQERSRVRAVITSSSHAAQAGRGRAGHMFQMCKRLELRGKNVDERRLGLWLNILNISVLKPRASHTDTTLSLLLLLLLILIYYRIVLLKDL